MAVGIGMTVAVARSVEDQIREDRKIGDAALFSKPARERVGQRLPDDPEIIVGGVHILDGAGFRGVHPCGPGTKPGDQELRVFVRRRCHELVERYPSEDGGMTRASAAARQRHIRGCNQELPDQFAHHVRGDQRLVHGSDDAARGLTTDGPGGQPQG